MLYSKGWKSGQKSLYPLILFLILLAGCDGSQQQAVKQLTIDDFKALRSSEYALHSTLIRENLEHILRADTDDASADRRVRAYYRERHPYVWLNRQGFDQRADTLIAELHRRISDIGFSERSFRLSQIETDLQRMRTLDFDSLRNTASRVAARLEYNLTKAYLRYVLGQRFGFTNPNYILNRLSPIATDSLGNPLGYHHLFDVEMDHPDKNYEFFALRKVGKDSLGLYLAEVLPQDSLYLQMKQRLPTASGSQRTRLLVNMERRRWRRHRNPDSSRPYVVVNVPAYHLWAVSPDTVIDLRAACGAIQTKTPLLSSYITRMDVNPEWIIPMSIISKDIAAHAGDPSYFTRRRYYIADRKTGEHISPANVTSAMLQSGKYRVAQLGGEGNSLGRIIFRFPNNFSVFLHDTSSRGVFGRDDRGVSHGCVRVQHPYELAAFLLGPEADAEKLQRLRFSMGLDETDATEDDDRPKHGPESMLRSLSVSPRVPLFITYYTLFQVPGGMLQTFPDVYGYDRALAAALKTYLQ